LNRLHEVVENVLLFSDLRPPEGTCSKREINARELLLGVVGRFRSLWQEKQLAVEIHWEPEVEKLNLDPRLIETAFKNLFLNAVQFNRKQGKIHIQARRIRSHVEISFADTGIGIPVNKLSRIFDSFYQVADYLTREVGGIGLGLALARRIVELHGGFIRVESREGEGSVFIVVLEDPARAGTDLGEQAV
jgi:signal transduction histidine kinase